MAEKINLLSIKVLKEMRGSGHIFNFYLMLIECYIPNSILPVQPIYPSFQIRFPKRACSGKCLGVPFVCVKKGFWRLSFFPFPRYEDYICFWLADCKITGAEVPVAASKFNYHCIS